MFLVFKQNIKSIQNLFHNIHNIDINIFEYLKKGKKDIIKCSIFIF